MDYLNVEPDVYTLMAKHFTPGRGGAKIEFLTLHHLAMVGDGPAVKRVWDIRPASAHYVVGPDGRVYQMVNDSDTAWANANQWANQRTIAIEHSNSAGAAQDWPISDATIIGGARLAAALCLYYGLGRPQFGKNIREHKEFAGTSCPYHLAAGGKYHQRWMDEARRFYDELKAKKEGRTAVPPTTPKKETTMADFDHINRRYPSRVEGSDVQMTPLDALLNADAHAWNNSQTLARIEQKLDAMGHRLTNLEGNK